MRRRNTSKVRSRTKRGWERKEGGRRGRGMLTAGPPSATELRMAEFGNLALVPGGLDDQN